MTSSRQLEAPAAPGPWRSERQRRIYEIVFEADTPSGRLFDVLLIGAIVMSVGVVMLDSVQGIARRHHDVMVSLEWGFTVLFTVEYLLRLYCAPSASRYARSFFGVVDLVAFLPSYLGLFVPEAQYILVVRVLRLLRIFRVLKLGHYLTEASTLGVALYASRRKILVFLFSVLTLVVLIGAAMHVIEGEAAGFTSIPRSIYWAIVTLTTVGYGDIAPVTPLGQFLAATVMILGYGIIAIPTGIVTVELSRASDTQRALEAGGTAPETERPVDLRRCVVCGSGGHSPDAVFCRRCGGRL